MTIICAFIFMFVIGALCGGKGKKKRKSTFGAGQTGLIRSKWSR